MRRSAARRRPPRGGARSRATRTRSCRRGPAAGEAVPMPAVAPVTSAVLMVRALYVAPGTGVGAAGRVTRCASPPGTSTPSAPASTASRPGSNAADVDVLAIQETKAREDQFPFDRFEALGYEVAHHGLSQWNGVAIALARRARGRRRSGSTGCPAGASPSPRRPARSGRPAAASACGRSTCPTAARSTTRTWRTSSQWLDRAAGAARGWVADGTAQVALVRRLEHRAAPTRTSGDGVLPRQDATSRPASAPPSRRPRRRLHDVVRPHTPGPGIYTYWDYQRLRFPKNRGMRIDFVLGSPAFAARVAAPPSTARSARARARSDHAPVVVELED